jgi:glutamate/tyrosine decarboxylase-like PLP-dependent enzyme
MTEPQPTPVDLPAEEFRRQGYAVIDRLVDHFATLRERPVYPDVSPLDLAPLFDAPPPETATPLEAILADWDNRIVPNSSLQGNPRFFGWVNGGGTQVGALADALASGLNPNPGGWRAAQAAVVIENQTIEWLARLLGLAPTAGGLFVSGGTMANTAALRLALCHTARWDIKAGGLQAADRPARLTVYMADHESHISLTKAVDLLGLGRDAIRRVPSQPDFTIDTAALDRMLSADIAAGMTPFCLVGHAGSINVGAIDDLATLADIAAARGLWFHVDGACGALGAMLPELRPRYAGMERADSVSFDAHKWLGVPYECGCVMVRQSAHLRQAFGVQASYLHETHDDRLEPFDFFDRGPQMSRGWRALKVWMSLRYYGATGYREFFRRTIDNARYLHQLVSAHPAWEVIQPEPALYIYAFRYVGSATDPADLDQLNARLADETKRRGVALVMTTRVHGRITQRLSIANHRTTRDDIREVFEAMTGIGAELAAG